MLVAWDLTARQLGVGVFGIRHLRTQAVSASAASWAGAELETAPANILLDATEHALRSLVCGGLEVDDDLLAGDHRGPR